MKLPDLTLRTTLLLFAAVLSFSSCDLLKPGDDPEPDPIIEEIKINISSSQITLPDTATGSSTFTITVNADWSISLSDTKAVPGWLSVSPTSGAAGTHTITVSVTEENLDYDDRNAYIKLTVGDKSENLTVTQKQKDAIIVSRDTYEVAVEGEVIEVEVRSNITYSVAVPPSCQEWITHKTTKGLSSSMEYFEIAEADEEGSREGMIIFESGELKDTVHVFQAQKDILILSGDELQVSSASGEYEIQIRTNIDYEATITKGAEWLGFSDTKATRVDKLHLLVDENTSYDARSGAIEFTNTDTGLTQTLTVIQSQKDALILTSDYYNIAAEGGNIEVLLMTNVEYKIDCPASWITESQTKGLNDRYHYFTVNANDEYDARKAFIIFTDTKNELSDTITVEQESNFDIFIDQTGYSISRDGGRIEVTVRTNLEDVGLIFHDNCSTWLSYDENAQTKALSDRVYTFVALANDTYDERVGQVTFQDPEGIFQKTITITQNQKNGLILSKKLYELPYEAGSVNIDLESNVEYEISILADWITEVTTKGLVSYHHEFAITENSDPHNRTGKIVVKDKASELIDTVKIKQAGKSSVTFDTYSFEKDYTAGTLKVIAHTNCDFSVSIPAYDSWLRYSGKSFENTGDAEEVTLTFTFDRNYIAEPRTSIVSITPEGASESAEIAITQTAALLPGSTEFGVYNNNTAVYTYSRYSDQTSLRTSRSAYIFRIQNLLEEKYCTLSSLPLNPTIGSTISFTVAVSSNISGISTGRKNGVIAKIENNIIWVLDSSDSSVCYILMK